MNLIAATGTDFLDFHSSVKFVAGAYIFVLLVIVVYVAIMGYRLARNQRELSDIRRLVEEREAADSMAAAPGFGHGSSADASVAAAGRERDAEAIRSEHQL